MSVAHRTTEYYLERMSAIKSGEDIANNRQVIDDLFDDSMNDRISDEDYKRIIEVTDTWVLRIIMRQHLQSIKNIERQMLQ